MFGYMCVCMCVRAGWFDAPLCVLCDDDDDDGDDVVQVGLRACVCVSVVRVCPKLFFVSSCVFGLCVCCVWPAWPEICSVVWLKL